MVTLRGYALVAAAAIGWGCWALFLGPARLSGPQGALVLFAVMSVPCLWLVPARPKIDRNAWVALGVLGLADAGNAALYFGAISRGPLSVAVLTHYLAPLFVGLGAPLVLREPRSRRALLAAPISLLGLMMLLGMPGDGFPLATALLGAGSAVFYAAIVISAKVAGRTLGAMQITALHAPISALALLLVFRGEALPPLEPRVLWAVAGAALCGLLATVSFNRGLIAVPAPAASALTYLEPVTASLLGVLVFAEAMRPVAVAGVAVVIAAGLFVAGERRQSEPAVATGA